MVVRSFMRTRRIPRHFAWKSSLPSRHLRSRQQTPPDVLAAMRQSASGSIERLASDCALVRYTQFAADRGQQLFITYWSVAHVLPPDHARVATFSYTLLDRQRNEARFQRELELLDREVRASIFSPEIGATSR